jgi:hypothetical protein
VNVHTCIIAIQSFSRLHESSRFYFVFKHEFSFIKNKKRLFIVRLTLLFIAIIINEKADSAYETHSVRFLDQHENTSMSTAHL